MPNPIEVPGLPNILYATLESLLAGFNYQLDAITGLPKLPAPPGPALFIDPFMGSFVVPFLPEFPAIPSSSPSIVLTAEAAIGTTFIEISDMSLIPDYPFLATLNDENIKIISGNEELLRLNLEIATEDLHVIDTPLELAASISMPSLPEPLVLIPPFLSGEDFTEVVTQWIKFVFSLVLFPLNFIIGLLSQLPVITLPDLEMCIEIVASAFEAAGLTMPDPENPDVTIPLPSIEKLAECMGKTVFEVVLGIVPVP